MRRVALAIAGLSLAAIALTGCAQTSEEQLAFAEYRIACIDLGGVSTQFSNWPYGGWEADCTFSFPDLPVVTK